MSTNSTLNVLTPKGLICFIFEKPVIWHGMLVSRVYMKSKHYYIALDEEVATDLYALYEGRMKITTTRICISKEQFLELLTSYLPELQWGE